MSSANASSTSAVRVSDQNPASRERYREESSAQAPSSLPSASAHLLFDRPQAAESRQPFGSVATRPTPVALIKAPIRIHLDVSTRFGQRLRELRTQRNLTQVRMAREFGVDRSYISDLERGRKSVSLPTLEIFALGLRLSLAELLTGI